MSVRFKTLDIIKAPNVLKKKKKNR